MVKKKKNLTNLGSLVLEPYLDLRLIQAQFSGQVRPAFLRQVLILCKLSFQTPQLLAREGGTRSFVISNAVVGGVEVVVGVVGECWKVIVAAACCCCSVLSLDFAGSWTFVGWK